MAKDILVDENNELLTKDGDFVTGDSEVQNLDHLMVASPGTVKRYGIIGAGVGRMVNARLGIDDMLRNIKLNLKADNWKDELIEENGADITVKANR